MSFNLQTTLKNDLVFLRPLIEEDFEELFESASDPLVWEQHQNQDRYTRKNFTTFFDDALTSKGALTIIDAQTNKIIGSTRFKMSASEGVVEIGWSFLGRSFWGGSYNQSFKKLMINYALLHCTYVIFYVNPKNYRSQKAMEKLGATKMRYLEKPWVLKEDVGVTYAIDSPLKD